MDETASDGMSRRDLLRNGAIAGGTLVWAVPMIQILDLSAAGAQSASPPPASPGGNVGGHVASPPGQPGTPSSGALPVTEVAGVQLARTTASAPSPGVGAAALAKTGAAVAVLTTGGAAAVATGTALRSISRRLDRTPSPATPRPQHLKAAEDDAGSG